MENNKQECRSLKNPNKSCQGGLLSKLCSYDDPKSSTRRFSQPQYTDKNEEKLSNKSELAGKKFYAVLPKAVLFLHSSSKIVSSPNNLYRAWKRAGCCMSVVTLPYSLRCFPRYHRNLSRQILYSAPTVPIFFGSKLTPFSGSVAIYSDYAGVPQGLSSFHIIHIRPVIWFDRAGSNRDSVRFQQTTNNRSLSEPTR